MPTLNGATPFGSPTPFASLTSPAPEPSTITAEQLAELLEPAIIRAAPAIALALAKTWSGEERRRVLSIRGWF